MNLLPVIDKCARRSVEREQTFKHCILRRVPLDSSRINEWKCLNACAVTWPHHGPCYTFNWTVLSIGHGARVVVVCSLVHWLVPPVRRLVSILVVLGVPLPVGACTLLCLSIIIPPSTTVLAQPTNQPTAPVPLLWPNKPSFVTCHIYYKFNFNNLTIDVVVDDQNGTVSYCQPTSRQTNKRTQNNSALSKVCHHHRRHSGL